MEINKNVPCKECITLAICLANISFIPNKHYKLDYKIEGIINSKCSVLKARYQRGPLNEWIKQKLFLMRQKGIEYDSKLF
jgi:hypothetical protein